MDAKHAEYHYRSETSDTVVVFIHGIQGSPLQFDYMVEALNGLYSIENLLLPGHGKTMKEFAGSGMREWQTYVDDRVRALENEYRNIILVGHSMGCLLAVQAAVSYPERIRGLFLLAVPLHIRVTLPYVKRCLTVAFCSGIKNERITEAMRLASVPPAAPFAYLANIPRYIELLKKAKATRALMRDLRLPAVVVQSAKDEIVSRRSLRYMERKQGVQVVLLNDSGHYYYTPNARERLSGILKDFVAKAIK